MFSKELENLIQATLEDGVLEEYEKAALFKRATAEGVDLTELEIYINSILQKRHREANEKKEVEYAKLDQQKKEAIGKVCPMCGCQVTPMTLVCECGYEFTNQKEVSSIQKLFEMLNSVKLTPSEEKEISEESVGLQQRKRNGYLTAKKIELISTFPVPNTKCDIIEFLSTSVSLANKKIGFLDTKKGFLTTWLIVGVIFVILFRFFLHAPRHTVSAGLFIVSVIGMVCYISKQFAEEKLRNVWHAKCEQVLMKGRSLRGDAEFSRQLNYYEKSLENKK